MAKKSNLTFMRLFLICLLPAAICFQQNVAASDKPVSEKMGAQLEKLREKYLALQQNNPEQFNPTDLNLPENSTSEPIYTGFYFWGGKYIEAPYIVERRGLDVYINDILVSSGPKHKLYDFSVDTDPGDPPAGVSPFDKPPETNDLRDNYYLKKWRYLYAHYDYETAKKKMFEIYKQCTEIENVHWIDSSKIAVTDKKKGIEISIPLTKPADNTPYEELVPGMERIREDYENSLQKDVVYFENGFLTIIPSGSDKIECLQVLISDISNDEKFQKLDNALMQGVKEMAPWIVTNFEYSPQLTERVLLMRAGYSKEDIAQRMKNSEGGFKANAENTESISEQVISKDMERFIKFQAVDSGMSYNRLKRTVTKDQLPALYKLLSDEEYAPYWHNIARIIGYISDDPNSVSILLDYFKRDDGDKVESIVGKIYSIALIGKIGGDEADAVLKKAITKEGAEELAKAWIDEAKWKKSERRNKEYVIERTQSAAISGLVYSGKKENWDIVEKLYNEQKDISIKSQKRTNIMSYLIDAMAIKAYIADNNNDVEVYFRLDLQAGSGPLKPYLDKYSLRKTSDGN